MKTIKRVLLSPSFFVYFHIFILLSPLLSPFVIPVQAATMSDASVTISDSRPGLESLPSFTFKTPSTTAIKYVVFQYCTTPTGACTAPTGMTLTASPGLGTVTGIAGTGYSAAGTNTNCTGTGNTDCTITLTVTTPSGQTQNQTVVVPFTSGVTNPTTANTTFWVRVTSQDTTPDTIDSATVASATLDTYSMLATATVDPTFTFSIAAVNTGTVNGATINVTTATASAIPFGTLSTGSTKISAHDITITTNAANGYQVTIASANPPMVGTTNPTENIDRYNVANSSPAAWGSPGGTTPSTNTGFLGYTTNSTSLCTGTPNRFSSNKWAGPETTPYEVACNSGGASGEITRIGWQAEVNGVQPADFYTGTLFLVATPTY